LAVVCALAGSVLVGGGVATDSPAAGPEPVLVREAVDSASALLAAKKQGSRVEVASERTATRTVYAHPDGRHSAVLTAVPTRVLDGDEWRAIDTTLVSQPDGSVRPEALDGDAVLSGGGSRAPLLRLREGQHELALHWPGTLPAPELDKNEATYREVFPGVDLVMRAEVSGYQQLLVIKNARAARNPALARVDLRVAATGLTLHAEPSGALSAVDAAGAPVFTSPPSVMWDARGEEAAVPVGLEVAGETLTLVPDQKFLADKATEYPVTVDPKLAGFTQSFWATVLSGYPNANYPRRSADDEHPLWAQVGQCHRGPPNRCNSIDEAWAYFQFETAFLGDKDVLSAKFYTSVGYSPACDGGNAHLIHTYHAPTRQDITWNNRPQGVLWREFSAPGIDCATHSAVGVKIDVLGALNGLGPTTLYLTPKHSAEQLAWRKYIVAETRMEVYWNRQPRTPENLRIDPPLREPCRWCAGKSYVSNQKVLLSATFGDPDDEGMFPRWRVSYNGVEGPSYEPPGCRTCTVQPNGATHNLDLDLRDRHGQEVSWWVHSDDGAKASPEARYPRTFVVDHKEPKVAPAVSSVAYPNVVNQWFGAAGAPGVFTFGPGAVCDAADTNQVCDIDHYVYDWNTDAPKTRVDATSLGGGAEVTTAPPTYGRQTLYVKSVDRAGNESATATVYTVMVRDTLGPRGQWSFEGNMTDTAYVGGRHGTLHGDASYTGGAVGTAVALTGTPGTYASAPNALRTDSSFTVSAWARADRKPSTGASLAVLSQEGADQSGWYLNYRGPENRWVFMMASAGSTPDVRYLQSKEAPRVGEWAHLTGVYDRPAHSFKLYVNGVFNSSMQLPPTMVPWRADGPLNVGRSKWKGNFIDYWPGAIDEVKTFDRVLTDAEVLALVSRDDVRTGHWTFDDEPTSTVAENAVAGGADATPRNGAKFTDGSVELDGKDDHLVTDGPVVNTDQSFTVSAWVTPDEVPADGTSMTAVSQDSPGNSGFHLMWSSMNKWVFLKWGAETDTGNAAWRGAVATQTPKIGEPTHLTGVYDGPTGKLTIYVDGEYGGETTLAAPAWQAVGPLVIGRSKVHPWGPMEYFNGKIDDVRTYSRAFTPAEIQAVRAAVDKPTGTWQLDGGTGDSAGNRHGTWSGTPQWTEGHAADPHPADQAARLTGSNAITAPKAVTTTDSYTVAAWVKLDRATGCYCTILSQDAQHTSGFSLGVGADGKWSMFASSGDHKDAVPSGAWAMLGEERTAQAGVWTHVAGVHNKKERQLELYINGARVQTVPFTNPISAAGDLQIGRTQWYAYPGQHVNNFVGAIDDVRVYGRPLFADQIRVLAGRDLALVHNWKFNEPTGTTAADSVGSRGGGLLGGARFEQEGRANGAVKLDTAADAVTASGVDVRTDQSFTVTSWVKLTAAGDCAQAECVRTAVSLDGGGGTSKFRLGHLQNQDQAQLDGKWFFEMPERDGGVTQVAISVNPATFGKWLLLVGVYDATSGQLELYVYSDNPMVGVDRETGFMEVPWQGAGVLTVGGGTSTGHFWRGAVDDVRIYTGHLSAAQLGALYASYPKAQPQ
jgi:hypothetical protein